MSFEKKAICWFYGQARCLALTRRGKCLRWFRPLEAAMSTNSTSTRSEDVGVQGKLSTTARLLLRSKRSVSYVFAVFGVGCLAANFYAGTYPHAKIISDRNTINDDYENNTECSRPTAHVGWRRETNLRPLWVRNDICRVLSWK